MTTAEASAALIAEIKQVRDLVSANVPLQSYWLDPAGQLWRVSEKYEDGTCWMVRGQKARYGRMSCLLREGYTRI